MIPKRGRPKENAGDWGRTWCPVLADLMSDRTDQIDRSIVAGAGDQWRAQKRHITSVAKRRATVGAAAAPLVRPKVADLGDSALHVWISTYAFHPTT